MSKKIVINPVTRISGFMEIEAYVENGKIVDAKTEGLFFRGFEKMLEGRNPFDAVYFTQRICGICSTDHSLASSLALENALGVIPSEEGRYLRDILHGCEFLQNHLRHFYQYTLPDFVKLPPQYPLYETDHLDFRLPKDKNDEMVKHFFESLDLSRQGHEMLSVLGGKAPHNQGIFIGGISTQATTDKTIKMKAIQSRIHRFIVDKMIPDVFVIGEYYKDYFYNGGGYGNLLSYGCFYDYKELGTLYLEPLVYRDGNILPFDANNITEEISYAWYQDGQNSFTPMDTPTEADQNKPHAYSFIKAPRYEDAPFETGPLARQIISGEYKGGISSMDRTIARVLEAKKIAQILEILLQQITPNVSVQQKYELPHASKGVGLIDTT
jgi:hydrogenase large subunit